MIIRDKRNGSERRATTAMTRPAAGALASVGLVALLIGCGGPQSSEDLGSTAENLATPAAGTSSYHAAGRAASALDVSFSSWSSDRGIHEASSTLPVTLHVVNNTSAPMDAGVSVEIAGLGVQRTQQLGHVLVPAKGARDLEWVPTTSPIKASGVLIRAMARVSYVQGGSTLSIPSEPLFTSFSADGARVFATVGDGNQVRARAAATRANGASATGTVDGKPAAAAVGDTQSAASPPRPSQNEVDLAAQSTPAERQLHLPIDDD